MSFNDVVSNIAHFTEQDSKVRIETIDGNFFDIDHLTFRFIQQITQNQPRDEFSELKAQKAEKIIKALLEKRILLSHSEKLQQTKTQQSSGLVLMNARVIKAIGSLLNPLLMSPKSCIGIFVTIFTFTCVYLSIDFEAKSQHLIKEFEVYDAVLLIVLFYLSSMFHELGHAVSCLKYTNRCDAIGLRLNYVFPAFYCNVSPILLLKNKYQKAAVGFSGGYFQALFLLPVLPFVDQPGIYFFCILSCATMVANLYPFARTDGYWILCDLLGYQDFIRGAIEAWRQDRFRAADLMFVSVYCISLFLLAVFALTSTLRLSEKLQAGHFAATDLVLSVILLFQMTFLLMMIAEAVRSVRRMKQSKIKI